MIFHGVLIPHFCARLVNKVNEQQAMLLQCNNNFIHPYFIIPIFEGENLVKLSYMRNFISKFQFKTFLRNKVLFCLHLKKA